MPFSYFRDFDCTEADLPPCAYCGGKLTAEYGSWWSIGCDECDITIEPFVTLSHAIIVLSRRAPVQVDEKVDIVK